MAIPVFWLRDSKVIYKMADQTRLMCASALQRPDVGEWRHSLSANGLKMILMALGSTGLIFFVYALTNIFDSFIDNGQRSCWLNRLKV
jgi:hypothetical protein